MKNDKMKMQYRVNEQIRSREVRIVGDDIESCVMPIAKALQLAEQKGLDLVEISPNAEPPVCRLIDYSKFLYQQKKKQKEQNAPVRIANKYEVNDVPKSQKDFMRDVEDKGIDVDNPAQFYIRGGTFLTTTDYANLHQSEEC